MPRKTYNDFLKEINTHHRQSNLLINTLNKCNTPTGARVAIESQPQVFSPLNNVTVSLEGVNDKPTIIRWIIALFKTVSNAIKKIWESLTNLAKRFVNFIKGLFKKAKTVQDNLMDDEIVSENIKTDTLNAIKEAAQDYPEEINDELNEQARRLLRLYNLKPNGVVGLTNDRLLKYFDGVDLKSRNLKALPDSVIYEIDPESLRVFDYLDKVHPLTSKVIEHHKSINSRYYFYVNKVNQLLSSKNLLSTFANVIQKEGDKVTAESIAKTFSDHVLTEFQDYRELPSEVITATVNVQFKEKETIKSLKENRRGKLALQRASELIFPTFITHPLNSAGNEPIRVSQHQLLEYTKNITLLIKSIETTRSHLFPNGVNSVAGFTLRDDALKRLLEDFKLDKHPQAKKIGETIIGLIKAVNQFTLKANQTWLTLASRQIAQLNHELTLIQKLTPKLVS